ncbi:MAG TPA: SRPBCC domain-containing protein, partial [Candidatus Paceibacterota bacterium]|nr:SRPBCC domain-containing protein [Candidatus Paceibacterota bacterium]
MNRATHVAERQFVTSRLFDVPRELVFKAFTDLDHLKRWWGPKGVGMTFEEFDPQPGGAWRFVMHNPDGLDHRSEHVFIEVVKPERLVLRDVLDREFQLTILITEETQRTRVTWCKSCNMIEECERGTPCAIKANGQQFDRLAAQLAIMAAKRPFVMSRILDAPRDLIWMVWTEPEHLRWWGPKGAEIHHHRYDFRPGGI